jgi:glutamate/tyrosine decarboxylase-like PLP-dependent enzyme
MLQLSIFIKANFYFRTSVHYFGFPLFVKTRITINLTLLSRRVLPEVEPGYIRPLLSETAPEEGEGWPAVMADLERVIMPGITHWHHPQFHAYFPAANSYPALVADMLSDAISCIGFSWVREQSVLAIGASGD